MKHSWPEGEGQCQNRGCLRARYTGMSGLNWGFHTRGVEGSAGRNPGPCNGEPTPKSEKALQHRWQQLGGQCRRMGCPWVRVGLTGSGVWVLRHVVTGKDWDGDRVPPCEGKS